MTNMMPDHMVSQLMTISRATTEKLTPTIE